MPAEASEASRPRRTPQARTLLVFRTFARRAARFYNRSANGRPSIRRPRRELSLSAAGARFSAQTGA